MNDSEHEEPFLESIFQRTPEEMFNIQERLNHFREVVAKVKSGEWTQAQFATWLSRMSDELYHKAQHIYECFDYPGYREWAAEEVETCTQGIELYEQGMEIMWQFTQDGDPSHLDRGLASVEEGNKLINHAMFLNQEAMEELDVNYFF